MNDTNDTNKLETYYKKIDFGIIHQYNYSKIIYDCEYSNKYNEYNEKANYLSYLRLGVLLGAINETPNSILDMEIHHF